MNFHHKSMIGIYSISIKLRYIKICFNTGVKMILMTYNLYDFDTLLLSILGRHFWINSIFYGTDQSDTLFAYSLSCFSDELNAGYTDIFR